MASGDPQLEKSFEVAFDENVQLAYQGTSVTRGKVYTKTGINGKSVQFRRRGETQMSPAVYNSPVTGGNLSMEVVTAMINDYEVAKRQSPFDLYKVNFDDGMQIAKAMGSAIGRQYDQTIIDALQAGATYTIAADYGSTSGNTGLTIDKINRIISMLEEHNVPMQDVCGLVTPQAKEGLRNSEKATSSLYVDHKAMNDGKIEKLAGMELLTVGGRKEGGLPVDGDNVASLYFFDKNAIGVAEGALSGQGDVRKQWSVEYQGWLYYGGLSIGSIVIEPEGIVEVKIQQV